MTRGWRWLRLVAPVLALMLATPAFADCADEVCASLQKILAARSGNFAKLKGKATVDPRGDPVWQGTQAIGGLINTCYVYKRGEGARYEYRCDSSGFGAEPSQHARKGEANRRSCESRLSGGRPDARVVRISGDARSRASRVFKERRVGMEATSSIKAWWPGSRSFSPMSPAMQRS